MAMCASVDYGNCHGLFDDVFPELLGVGVLGVEAVEDAVELEEELVELELLSPLAALW